MRVVWIKVGGLWPLNTGGRLRTFEILSSLSADHEVVLLTTHGPDDDPQALRRHLPRLNRVVSVPYVVPKQGSASFKAALVRSWLSREPVDLWRWRVPEIRRQAEQLLASESWDAVVADFLVAGANVPADAGVPIVFFEHNVEHQIWRRLASVERNWWKRLALEMEWRKMRRRESAMMQRAAVTVAVSEIDRRKLLDDLPGAAVEVVPTGVDTTYFRPTDRPTVPRRLVFSGSMDWYPNEDGILDFAAHVWPRLRRAFPDISLTVVGRRPSARLLEAGRTHGITVTGTVPDVRPYIDEAEIYIVPLRVGGGTRLKIFEALAMQKPVISTTIGAEGLGLTDRLHYLAADSHDAFFTAIEQLLHDAPMRAELAAAGRALVVSQYSWPQVTRRFVQALQRAAAA